MRSSQARVRVARVSKDAGRTHRADTLAVEEPLEIRVNGTRLAVTMRTPVHDFSLAVGFALSEGIIRSADDVTSVRYCQKDQGPKGLNPIGRLNVGAETSAALAWPLTLGSFPRPSVGLAVPSATVLEVPIA